LADPTPCTATTNVACYELWFVIDRMQDEPTLWHALNGDNLMNVKSKLTLSAAFCMGLTATTAAAECADPIKVGVLHSLSGTMAISETTLKDTMEMLIASQNEAGGLLDCEIEAVVVDPASDWPLFAEKARELLTVHEVGDRRVERSAVLPCSV